MPPEREKRAKQSKGPAMEHALTMHRLQFAFTITFHYIFPQLTMGLALLIGVFSFFLESAFSYRFECQGRRLWFAFGPGLVDFRHAAHRWLLRSGLSGIQREGRGSRRGPHSSALTVYADTAQPR
jgi:hypothetical protein